MRVTVIGDPPKPPFFLVSNHLGYVDIAALRSVVDGVFVAKSEILKWPLAGKIISDLGTIFIDRGNRRDIKRAGSNIVRRLDMGEGVIVFPEGTNTTGASVLPFNSSFLQFASEGDLPVNFATISYSTTDDDPPASSHVCWGDDLTFFPHMFRMFMISGFSATIRFGSESISNPDRKELARELHRRVSQHFAPVN